MNAGSHHVAPARRDQKKKECHQSERQVGLGKSRDEAMDWAVSRSEPHMRSFAVLTLAPFSTVSFARVSGSGIKRTETRSIPEFTEVEVADGVRFELTAGPPSLVIEGDDNVVPLYVTQVTKGRLRVGIQPGASVNPRLPLVVRASSAGITQLQGSGGVELLLTGVVSPRLAVTISGGADFTAATLKAEALNLNALGGASVTLGGSATQTDFTLSGGVELKAKDLAASRVRIHASGGVDATVTASQAIEGNVSGGVTLQVHGRPNPASVSSSGGADVVYLD